MAIQLTLMIAGSCQQYGRLVQGTGPWRLVTFPAMVGVIEHSEYGLILFDSGYSHRFFHETKLLSARIYRWLTPITCTAADTAAAQLANRGISPERVKMIIISHFHADHIGGLRDFPNAQFLYSRHALNPQWRTQSPWTSLRHGLLPGLLPDDFCERSRYLDSCQPVHLSHWGQSYQGQGFDQLGQGFDLLGDESLLAYDLSGHAPGQIGVFIPHTQGPPVMLLADACWHRRAITHGDLPHPVTRLLTADHTRYRQRIEIVRQVANSHPEIMFVPSHCMESIDMARQSLGVGR